MTIESNRTHVSTWPRILSHAIPAIDRKIVTSRACGNRLRRLGERPIAIRLELRQAASPGTLATSVRMEPVTHFLTGACLARAGFNRRTAYATLAMTLAAEAPDLDVLWAFRGPVAALQHHRGITHTFLGAPFVALAVTGTVYLWHRFRNPKENEYSSSSKNPGAPSFESSATGENHEAPNSNVPPRLKTKLVPHLLFALIADLSHLHLDYTNNYGVRPFFPSIRAGTASSSSSLTRLSCSPSSARSSCRGSSASPMARSARAARSSGDAAGRSPPWSSSCFLAV